MASNPGIISITTRKVTYTHRHFLQFYLRTAISVTKSRLLHFLFNFNLFISNLSISLIPSLVPFFFDFTLILKIARCSSFTNHNSSLFNRTEDSSFTLSQSWNPRRRLGAIGAAAFHSSSLGLSRLLSLCQACRLRS
jgi:hypothetical protein